MNHIALVKFAQAFQGVQPSNNKFSSFACVSALSNNIPPKLRHIFEASCDVLYQIEIKGLKLE